MSLDFVRTRLSNMHRCCAFPFALAGLFLFIYWCRVWSCRFDGVMRLCVCNSMETAQQQNALSSSLASSSFNAVSPSVSSPLPAQVCHYYLIIICTCLSNPGILLLFIKCINLNLCACTEVCYKTAEFDGRKALARTWRLVSH